MAPGAAAASSEVKQVSLITATRKGDLHQVRSLLEAGANPDSPDDHGETALFEAVEGSNLDVVAALLHARANPYHKSKDGMIARELTADKDMMTLMDLYDKKEVSANNKKQVTLKLGSESIDKLENYLAPKVPHELTAEKDLLMSMGPFNREEVPANKKETKQPMQQQAPLDEESILKAHRQIFEVTNAKRCKVYKKPDLKSTVLAIKSRGAYVYGKELRVNGWMRLDDQTGGWMLIDMRGIGGLREVLRPWPPDRPPELVVRPYRSQGVCCLEVCCESLVVRTAPSEAASVVSVRYMNEYLFVVTQSFNGWVKLADGRGWVQGQALGEPPSVRLPLSQNTNDADLWALNDLWEAWRNSSRAESASGLDDQDVQALKEIEEDALQSTYEKLGTCRPGRSADFRALGLTDEDMRQPWRSIVRRLFFVCLKQLLGAWAPTERMPTLMPYKHPGLLREVVQTMDLLTPSGDFQRCELGEDQTLYDQTNGEVVGIWIPQTQTVLPMTHVGVLYGAPSELADTGNSTGQTQKSPRSLPPKEDVQMDSLAAEAPGTAPQKGKESPTVPEDYWTAEDDGPRMRISYALSILRSGRPDAAQFALSELDRASRDYRHSSEVDVGLERELLHARAVCFADLGQHEDVLLETDRLLGLMVMPAGPRRSSTLPYDWNALRGAWHGIDEVKDLRQDAFMSRWASRAVPDRRPSLVFITDTSGEDWLSDID